MKEWDRERLVGLLAARERGALGVEDERALQELVSEVPAAAADTGWNEALDRLLTYMGTTDLDEEEFTRGVAARIAAENRGEGFVRRVTQASRRLRRRPSKDPAQGWGLAIFAAAAGLLIALVLALAHGPASSRRTESLTTPRIAATDAPGEESPVPTPPRPKPRTDNPLQGKPPKPLQETPVQVPQPFKIPERGPDPTPDVPAPSPSTTTVASLGTVERVEGTTSVREGQALLVGQTVETKGKVVLRMNDRTRLDLDEEASLRIEDEGRRMFLARGTLTAEVAKQPKGSPLVFETPYGRATVLGTTLRLIVEREALRLEVLEGKVRLSGENAKTVDVAAGQFAVAGAGLELKAKPIPDPRVTEGLRALYVFEEGKGRVIRDMSGVGTPLNLVAKDEGDLAWLPGGGLSLRSTTLLASSGPATKIVSACRASRAITVEAWIKPAQVEKGTLRYVAALSGPRKESLAFGLGLHSDIGNGPTTYRSYLSTPKTTPTTDTMPELESAPIVPGLAHIVFTRSASGTAVLYIDGQLKASGTVEGEFSNWSDGLRVMIGDYSFEGIRPWLGDFYLLAFYNRALKPEEVAQNFGVGKRKYSPKK